MRRPPHTRRRTTRILGILAAAAILGLVGCGGGDGGTGAAGTTGATTPATAPPTPATTTTATTTTGATTTTSAPKRTVTVYFADADAQQLVPETRSVSTSGSDLRAALVALADGPTQPSLQPALPAGTTIIGTNVRDGEALVNLSREFQTGYPPGGAAAEFAVLGALVYTATGVDGVERVRITVDGQTPVPAGSQYDWSGTFSRSDFPDVTP